LIPDEVKWSFIVLEVVKVEDASAAEKFYYDYLEPRLNKQVPGRTHVESKAAYHAAHPEKVIEANRLYYLKRKAKNAN
jgi:hypothetical protein